MTRRELHCTCALGAVAIAAALTPHIAVAQQAQPPEEAAPTASNEIVVTAQRREERSVDVPISVATLGSQQLETASIDEISDISKVTPGVRFDFSSGFFQPTIRGVGTANVTSAAAATWASTSTAFIRPTRSPPTSTCSSFRASRF